MYLRKSSFASGELDPALRERTNLDKYQAGLATLRNAFIGKTGRIISRAGTRFVRKPKYSNRKCIIDAPPYSPYLIEWGHQYVRIHDAYQSDLLDAPTYSEDAHDFTEDDLPFIQFAYQGRYAYIFREGKKMKKMVLGPIVPFTPFLGSRFLNDAEIAYVPGPVSLAAFTTTSTGYFVEYVMTYVINGQESIISNLLTGGAIKMPINAGESNILRLNYGPPNPFGTTPIYPTEARVYRRPVSGNAFGYIGSTGTWKMVGADLIFEYTDVGVGADYTHSPPIFNYDIIAAKPKTGTFYQQRLVVSDYVNKEAMISSRPGYPNNFTKDYPVGADSSLTFKGGTSGAANVLRLLDYNGLNAFTSVGIYTNQGPLTPENIAMDKKGNWVIDETIKPLEIPGGVLFVDRSTNTIRSLIFSNEAGGYPGTEVSIFSNHLFLGKRVTSWTFQDGDAPLVWVTLDDGSLVSLTYQREHEMQAWARHDSDGAQFEYSATVKDQAKSTTYFIVKRGTERYIECTSTRFILDIKEFIGVDCAVTKNATLNALSGGAQFNIVAEDPTDWEGRLTLTASFGVFVNTADNGAVGTTWRFFDKVGSAVTLTVVQFISATQVVVTPSAEFPFDQNSNITLYQLFNVISAAHLPEGQLVSVMVDGYVISSPNNTIEEYPEIRVTGGTVTLPNELKGAFIRIGVPFTSDVETLDVDTLEQKPTLLESKIVNRVFMKVYRTRGTYVSSSFPPNDKLSDPLDLDNVMEDPEQLNDEVDAGNAAQNLITKRYNIPIPNDWDSSGRICIRQVDPLPFEILSLIPDITVP